MLMVKNEEANLRRVLESVKNTKEIDAIVIVDTGSSDSTVEVAKRLTAGTTRHICSVKFTDFGETRTQVFDRARKFTRALGWPDAETYGLLLDADYELLNFGFDKSKLVNTGYSLMQTTCGIEYWNIRLIRFDVDWKCIGVVHEYWTGGTNTQLHTLQIRDHATNSTKEKQEWYKTLLERGLKEEPQNARYVFYLAQTYNILGEKYQAIKYYRTRVNMGGYQEEVWYSMYQLVKIYSRLDLEMMEYWVLRALAINPQRSETLIVAASAMKNAGKHDKAFAYKTLVKPMPESGLFLEPQLYKSSECVIL